MNFLKQTHKDEYDFRSLFDLLIKYNKVFVATPLIFAVIGLIVAKFFLVHTYQSSFYLKIGRVGNELIETSTSLEKKINQLSFLEQNLKVRNEGKLRLVAEPDLNDKDIIIVNLFTPSQYQAQSILSFVYDQLIVEHNKIFDQKIVIINQKMILVNNEINDILNSNSKAFLFKGNSDFRFNQWQLIQYLGALRNKKMELQISLNDSFRTSMIGDFQIPKNPIFPDYASILILSIFLGFFASLIGIVLYDLKR